MIRVVLAVAMAAGALDPAYGDKGDKKPPEVRPPPSKIVRTIRLCRGNKPCPCWALWRERITEDC